MKSTQLSVVVIVVVGAILASPYSAGADSISGATWSGTANIGFVQNGSCCQGVQTPVTGPGTTTTTSPDGKAVSQMVGTNTPSLTASATSSSSNDEAFGNIQLNYFIEVVGPTSGVVILHIASNASVSVTGPSASALMQFSVNGSQIGGVSLTSSSLSTAGIGMPSTFDPSSFTMSATLLVGANREIPVTMLAGATAQLANVSATAFIDPFFFTDAPGFSVITSDGIGNSPSVAVPGPIVGAGLPGILFAGGGLLAWWRRKRKARAAA